MYSDYKRRMEMRDNCTVVQHGDTLDTLLFFGHRDARTESKIPSRRRHAWFGIAWTVGAYLILVQTTLK